MYIYEIIIVRLGPCRRISFWKRGALCLGKRSIKVGKMLYFVSRNLHHANKVHVKKEPDLF
jgi:hypothetical protein